MLVRDPEFLAGDYTIRWLEQWLAADGKESAFHEGKRAAARYFFSASGVILLIGALAIGGNHFMHACRRNVDLTYIVMDNHVYGMTKGQASPTTEPDWDNKLSPGGTGIRSFHPLVIALASGANFVARAFSGDTGGTARIIAEAIRRSTVQAASYGWYPTGLNSGHELRGNYLRSVDDYPALTMAGSIEVSATVANRGRRAAEEVVQLYVHQRTGSVTRPVRELKAFRKIALARFARNLGTMMASGVPILEALLSGARPDA